MTAVRALAGGRVAVELDGAPWRVVPAEAAYGAGIAPGLELDRPTARTLRQELRRVEALDAALGSLRHRDRSRAGLDERLRRRGIVGRERERAIETLAGAGVVDDSRFAQARAAALADRGAGDLLVADDLERQGVGSDVIEAALAALAPEQARAAAIVERRGRSAKTLRFLAGKGFREQTLESLVADFEADALA